MIPQRSFHLCYKPSCKLKFSYPQECTQDILHPQRFELGPRVPIGKSNPQLRHHMIPFAWNKPERQGEQETWHNHIGVEMALLNSLI